jgi:osmotically-inducible protein OsmY
MDSKGVLIMSKRRAIARFVVFVGLFAALQGCSTSQSHESTGQYVDDSVVTSKVKSAIVSDMALKGFQINVKTYQGVVQLSGFVDSAQNANKAAELARGVNGVTDVKNDLIVK